ncbi:MAG: IS481 family transposase [Actinobacteria bacterium]|nr:IS481 family transposase [Actinomycetota bacterium]
MQFHRNAKLGLSGRHELVLAIAAGSSIRNAAATFNVSTATAHRWWQRWKQASAAERRSLSCLFDRSSRPVRTPRRLAPEAEQAICECRRSTGWGPRLVAGATGFAHSTVWKVLHRFGLSRPPRPRREPANRYEWPCPGDLLHMDVSEYVRFKRPGHRVTGDRRSQDHSPDGVDYVHAVVDDHSRLAYAEIHEDARADTTAAFLGRALAFYATHGISVRRVLTDNAWAYTKGRAFRELLADHGIRHLRTKAYRPRTNGKVERFHQTMAREWAHGVVYRSHRERAAALPHWLEHYNQGRPHSSLGGRSPISRVHNVCG